MSINPETQYPGKIAPSDADYPYGSARNITTPGDGTGTPWEAAIVNDLLGWQQEILDRASIVPSGTPDKVGASQYMVGLDILLKSKFETLTGGTVISSMSADVAFSKYTPLLGDTRQVSKFSSTSKGSPQVWEVIDVDIAPPVDTEIETINSRKVWLFEGELYIEKSPGGNCYKWKPIINGVVHLAIYGALFDASTSDSDALDQAIEYGWNNYTEKLVILGDDGLTLSKAGDHVFPPNAIFSCTSRGGKLWHGDQLTRLHFKRDNSRVAVEHQSDGEYWALGPNAIFNWVGKVLDAVVSVDNCILVSDLIQFNTRFVSFQDAKVDVQLFFENDSKWTEFWDIEGWFSVGLTAAIKFSKKAAGTGTNSFGHGRFSGRLNSRIDAGSGVLITDNASPYNSQWNTQGFIAAPTGGQDAALFRLSAGGSLRYASFDCTIENLGNNGTPHAINSDGTGGSIVVFCKGLFHGIGTETKFRGVGFNNDIEMVGGKLINSSGAEIFQGNEVFKVVTGASDIDGDNLLRLTDEKMLTFNPGALVANGNLGILPISFNRARIASVQILAGTAGSGNTGSSERVLDITPVTSVLEVGETITGGTSGATGTIISIALDGLSIRVGSIVGTFAAAETITGGTSGATATVGAVNGVWHLGIIKQGATNPSATMVIADGSTVGYEDIFFDVPEAWNELAANRISWRSSDGTGNDGTAPLDVIVLIKYYEL